MNCKCGHVIVTQSPVVVELDYEEYRSYCPFCGRPAISCITFGAPHEVGKSVRNANT